jgi:hypothetical protein
MIFSRSDFSELRRHSSWSGPAGVLGLFLSAKDAGFDAVIQFLKKVTTFMTESNRNLSIPTADHQWSTTTPTPNLHHPSVPLYRFYPMLHALMRIVDGAHSPRNNLSQ